MIDDKQAEEEIGESWSEPLKKDGRQRCYFRDFLLVLSSSVPRSIRTAVKRGCPVILRAASTFFQLGLCDIRVAGNSVHRRTCHLLGLSLCRSAKDPRGRRCLRELPSGWLRPSNNVIIKVLSVCRCGQRSLSMYRPIRDIQSWRCVEVSSYGVDCEVRHNDLSLSLSLSQS